MTSNKSYKFTTGSILLGLKLSAGKPNGCSFYSWCCEKLYLWTQMLFLGPFCSFEEVEKCSTELFRYK